MNPETEFREGLDELAGHYTEILKLLGEDPEREGLVKTPMRVAKAMQILTRGYTQDRLTQQIKDCIQETLNPQGVMVVIEAKHMCMQMRGVEKQNSITTTSDYSGVFNSLNTRQEFMSLLRGETKRI